MATLKNSQEANCDEMTGKKTTYRGSSYRSAQTPTFSSGSCDDYYHVRTNFKSSTCNPPSFCKFHRAGVRRCYTINWQWRGFRPGTISCKKKTPGSPDSNVNSSTTKKETIICHSCMISLVTIWVISIREGLWPTGCLSKRWVEERLRLSGGWGGSNEHNSICNCVVIMECSVTS